MMRFFIIQQEVLFHIRKDGRFLDKNKHVRVAWKFSFTILILILVVSVSGVITKVIPFRIPLPLIQIADRGTFGLASVWFYMSPLILNSS